MYTKKQFFTDAAIVLFTSVIRALSMHVFILPNGFAPGGVTGIAAMIEYMTGFSSGYIVFAMNIPLLILALKYINKGFAFKTLVGTVLTSALLIVLKQINFEQFKPEEKIFAALSAGALIGTALAFMLKIGGSTGGSDIVAYIIQKKNEATSVARYIFAIDATVIGISYFVYGFSIEPVILSIVELYVSSKVVEAVVQGAKSAFKFEVITDAPDELIAELLDSVKCGVTKINAVGAYSNTEKAMLFCIVRKRDVTAFRAVLKRFSGTTFSYISSATEVIGRGFSS